MESDKLFCAYCNMDNDIILPVEDVMENLRQKFIDDALRLIESKYNRLTDKERNDLIYFKNQKQLSSRDFTKLMDLAESLKIKY